MHFLPHEIVRTVSAFDEKLGKQLSCSLKIPKLQLGSIPSQFPNCPDYLSKQNSAPRASREEKLRLKEEEQLAKVLHKSRKENDAREEKDSCKSKDDIIRKLVINKPGI